MRTEEECWELLEYRAEIIVAWFLDEDEPCRLQEYARLRGHLNSTTENNSSYVALVLNEIIDIVIMPLVEAGTHYEEWFAKQEAQYCGQTFMWRDKNNQAFVVDVMKFFPAKVQCLVQVGAGAPPISD